MSDWRPFVYGGLASVTAECGTFPIDTTKTRLQVQGQLIDARHTELKYRGMSHAILRIASEEGACALYSGLFHCSGAVTPTDLLANFTARRWGMFSDPADDCNCILSRRLAPAVLRQATYGTIKIGLYHTMKRAIFKDPKDETLLPNVCCGITAGVVSSSIANPTDVLKVRMQMRNEHFKKKGLSQSFMDILRQEGVGGLWRGVGPTANRAAVVCGVELPIYDIVKKHILRLELLPDTVITHFISSFTAGLAGALASNPIDVVKTRMMNQRKLKVVGGANLPAIYTGSLDCLVQTFRTEGFLALYKGFIPNWVRLGPWNVIFFITFEQMKKLH